MGGAQVSVAAGRRTRIDELALDDDVARGVVVTVDDGLPVDAGDVLVSIQPEGRVEEETVRGGELRQGRFLIPLELPPDPSVGSWLVQAITAERWPWRLPRARR